MPDPAANPEPAQGAAARVGAVRRFLRLSRSGSGPDVAGFLAGEPGLGPAERLAVLRADQRRRWRAGDRVAAEWYFEAFPDLADDPDLAIDLVHGEFLLREEAGGAPDLDDFVARFPAFAETIRVQVAFHRALDVAAAAERTPAPGRSRTPTVPGYEVVRELGVGGMGVVYLAYQLGLKRRVALKMVHAGGRADPEQLARFHLEAEAAACLHHPNIVEIYEIGDLDGCPYFSLELVEGPDLARELAGRPASARRAAQVAETLARAMHYAHERGVVHRDLKPANVLLTPEGVPKIADFGLAKLQGQESAQTQTGTILGSPCYMAPEQASGSAREVGPASDVYALGAILYEMLTGAPPFLSATPLDTLHRLLNEEPVRPSRLAPKVPRDLETICLKCLEKSPARRYPTAGALADDLGRFLNFESVLARPVAAPERLWRWCRRKTSLAIAVGLAAAAILTAVGLSVSLAVYQYRAASRIGKALGEVESRQREVDRLAAQLAYGHGQSLCEQGDVGQGMLWLVRGLKGADHARDRDLGRALRLNLSAWRPRLHPMRVRIEHPGAVHSVAYSPDGLTVATAGDDNTARVWDAATGEPVGLALAHSARVSSVAFSPDGRRLLTGCDDGAARFWDLDTCEQAGPVLRHRDPVHCVAFSPDGRTVVTGSYDRTARLWDAETGAAIGAPMRHDWFVAAVAFSPDGRELLTGGWDKTARRWRADTGAPVGPPIVHKDWVCAVAYSPDGTTLLTGCYDQTARLWGRETGLPVGGPFRHQHCVDSVAFSPDGSKVLVGCNDGSVRLWDVASGRPLGALLRHRHSVYSAVFSPDGRRVLTGGVDRAAVIWEVARPAGLSFRHDGFIRAMIFSRDGAKILSASQDHTARLWDAKTGAPLAGPLRHGDSVEAIGLSPDGRYALTGSYDGTARVWDASTGAPVGEPLRHGDRVTAVAFSPDGRTVLTGSDDKTARLWDPRTGAPVGPPLAHDGAVQAVAFSPDGRYALTGSADRTARLWRAADGAPAGPPLRHGGNVLALAFSPDGRTFLTGSEDMTARLWDAETLKPRVAPLKHQGPVNVAAFSPDGRTAITGGWDRVARLWDARTGLPEAPPLRHDGRLRALAISPDGKTVLTGSYDRSAQLWDKVTGMIVGPAFRHQSQVWFVAFSPDGRVALSGGQEPEAHLWDLPAATDGPIDRVETSVEVATGMTLDDDGSLRFLDVPTWSMRRERLDAGRPR